MKKSFPPGWRAVAVVLLLLASRSAGPVYAQSPSDATFLATLGELRDATFDDKDKIVDQLAQSGHPSVEAVLTAFLRGSPLLPQPGSEGLPRQAGRRRFTDARSDRSDHSESCRLRLC